MVMGVQLVSVKFNEKTGKWEIRVWYKDFTGASKQTTKRGFRTKQEALKWEREFLLKQNGSLKMKFGRFVELYLEEAGAHVRPSTLANKKHVITTKILPYFENKNIDEITSADVKKWQARLIKSKSKYGKPYSPDYLRSIHSQLSAIFNYAVTIYGLRNNPARSAGGMGKEVKKMFDFWTKEEFLKFMEQDVIIANPETYYAFEVLYWTGIRKGELLALTPSDFNFEEHTLKIDKQCHVYKDTVTYSDPKTDKSKRTIVIPYFLVEDIKHYLSLLYNPAPDERIFTFGEKHLNRFIKNGARKAGITEIDVHGLRHSHVSLLINMGFSALAIGERVGHEAQVITYRYAHLFNGEQARMAAALDTEMKER